MHNPVIQVSQGFFLKKENTNFSSSKNTQKKIYLYTFNIKKINRLFYGIFYRMGESH